MWTRAAGIGMRDALVPGVVPQLARDAPLAFGGTPLGAFTAAFGLPGFSDMVAHAASAAATDAAVAGDACAARRDSASRNHTGDAGDAAVRDS